MSKNKTMINDLTQGSVTKQLVLFALPFMLSNLLQTAYNMVDMIIIGQFVGSAGLSAVSNGGEILHVCMLLCMGFATAGQIMISQFVGMGDHKALSRVIGTLFSFLLLMSVLASAIGFIFIDKILDLINIPPEAWDQAKAYSLVCFAGMVFVFGYNLVSAILRGMGDSKRPFVFIAVASVVNLLLDLLFVAVFHWDAMGAALATVIGQGVSFVGSLIYLYINREAFGFDFKLRSFAIDPQILKGILKLGVPMGLQFGAITISMLFVASYTNSYGVVVSAVTAIGSKLGTLSGLVSGALNQAAGSMIGQNFGAGKHDRVKRIVFDVLWIGLIFGALLSVIMILFPQQVFSIFNTDPEVLAWADAYVPIAVLNFIGAALRMPFMGLINGIGFASLAFAVGILDGVVARVGIAMLLGITFEMGIMGFWYGNVIAGFVPFIIGGIYFASGKWKTKKVVVKSK
ncbi:MAG: MATE family efflux transporter [Ruminococcaceae bacterium]|nr:MATE family efflux transporter [Oscillospiraceae bacterium]